MGLDFFRQPAGPFTFSVLEAAKRHAAEEAPREACGLVRGGRYVACANIDPLPESRFEIDPDALAAAYFKGDLEGVIHSHPLARAGEIGAAGPSEADMRGQLETGVPWAIVVPGEPVPVDAPASGELLCWWGDDIPRPPLFDADGRHLARVFLHGVSDCYSLIRDHHLDRTGVALPEIPRGWEWWTAGGDLYRAHFAEAGFEVVTQDYREAMRFAQPGDVMLKRVGARIPNHAAVYLGGGRALEHLWGRLSEVRAAAPSMAGVTHLLRYVG